MGKKRVIKKGEEGVRVQGTPVSGGTAPKTQKKSTAKKIPVGRVYIYCSYNNTMMTLTDDAGNVVATASAGAIGFKGTKKATPFAASKVAETVAQTAKSKGMEKISVVLRGVGSGRDSALRSIGGKGFEVTSISDKTPIPHNGPRPRKVRRV